MQPGRGRAQPKAPDPPVPPSIVSWRTVVQLPMVPAVRDRTWVVFHLGQRRMKHGTSIKVFSTAVFNHGEHADVLLS